MMWLVMYMNKHGFSVKCELFHGLWTFPVQVADHKEDEFGYTRSYRLNRSPVFRCCVDTGSNSTTISQRVVETLRSKPIQDSMITMSINAIQKSLLYNVDILLPNQYLIPGHYAVAVSNQVDVLIGMDVIGKGDLAMTTKEGVQYLSWLPAHKYQIDFLSMSVLQQL